MCDPQDGQGGGDGGQWVYVVAHHYIFARLFLIRVIPMRLSAESLETVVRLLSLLFITPQQLIRKDSIAPGGGLES